MLKTRSLYKYSLGFVLVLIILFFLTLRPGSDHSTIDIPHFDKLAHCFFFMVLGFLLIGALNIEIKITSFVIVTWVTILVLTCIGIVIELLQLKIEGRSASYGDALADFVGISIGVIIYGRYRKILKGR